MLSATPRTLIVGQPSAILAHVAAGGKPVLGARVTLIGPGALDRRYTDANGTIRFPVAPSGPGILRLATQRQFGCRKAAKARIAAITLTRPAPTGGLG
jgi:hypothetical protein